jgi:hypothetical protein
MMSFVGYRVIQGVLEGILTWPVDAIPFVVVCAAFCGIVCYRILTYTPDCIEAHSGSIPGKDGRHETNMGLSA